VDGMKEREAIQGVILAGTELPLLLRDASHKGIPFLDTTKIHVDAILAQALA
jgi:aspartate racemase